MENNINVIYNDKINNLEKINKKFGHIITLLNKYMGEVPHDMSVNISLNIKF